jgi:hypothetical protein
MGFWRNSDDEKRFAAGFDTLVREFATGTNVVGDPALRNCIVERLFAELGSEAETITPIDLENGWQNVAWQPGPLVMDLMISPLLIRPDGGQYMTITAAVAVGGAPSEAIALGYVVDHCGIASTTYAWVYDHLYKLYSTTSVHLTVGGATTEVDLAKSVLWETYSAAVGKAVWIFTEGGGQGFTHMFDDHPFEGFDPERPNPILYESVRLHELGTNTKNPWAALSSTWSSEWLRNLIRPYLGNEIAHAMPGGEYRTFLPFMRLLASRPSERSHVGAALTVVPDVHPYIGPGLRLTLEMPHTTAGFVDAARLCNLLNQHEIHTVAFGTPAQGAWMVKPAPVGNVDGEQICFTTFYATAYHSLFNIEATASQMFSRAQQFSDILGPCHVGSSEHVDLSTLNTGHPWGEPMDLGPLELPGDYLLATMPNRDPSTTPDAGAGWESLRSLIQLRLTLDDEWCIDGHEHLWWWPSVFPIEVGVPLFRPAAPDGITRRLVRVRTHVGTVSTAADLELVTMYLREWNVSRPGGVATVDTDRQISITFTLTVSDLISHSARAVTNSMALQSSYTLLLFADLSGKGLIEATPPEHPISGLRENIDEIAKLNLPDGVGPSLFDVLSYFDHDVLDSYGRLMRDSFGLEPGWSNAEACYFQRPGRPDRAVGMGLMAAAEGWYGSGVRYTSAAFAVIDASRPELVDEICNRLNLELARAPEITGETIPCTGSVQTAPYQDNMCMLFLESFIPADVLHDYNTEQSSADQQAGVLASYALLVLYQAEYLSTLCDS